MGMRSVTVFEQVGARTLARLRAVLYALGFFVQILVETFRFLGRKKKGYRVLTFQILFTGVEALGVRDSLFTQYSSP
jgi:hypothetical protein